MRRPSLTGPVDGVARSGDGLPFIEQQVAHHRHDGVHDDPRTPSRSLDLFAIAHRI
jgi:hypothetical protein